MSGNRNSLSARRSGGIEDATWGEVFGVAGAFFRRLLHSPFAAVIALVLGWAGEKMF